MPPPPPPLAYRALFLPPVNRTMRQLDTSFFKRSVPLAAAHVLDVRNVARVKRECASELLDLPRIKPMLYDAGRHLVLFEPGVKVHDPETHSAKIKFFRDELQWMKLTPYTLHLDYDYWLYEDILAAILPENVGIPGRSYQPINTIGNLVLKPRFMKYKEIIAQVLLSKTPQLKSVVMKPPPAPVKEEEEEEGVDATPPAVLPPIPPVGVTPPAITDPPSPPLLHLAGDPSTLVTLREGGHSFTFDYALTDYATPFIYANKTLLQHFPPRSAIALLSSSIGTLAIPAASQKLLIYANNPNAHNHATLTSNIPTNPPASQFILPFNLPPQTFIRTAITTLFARYRDQTTSHAKLPLQWLDKAAPPPTQPYRLPNYFSAFVVPLDVGGLSALRYFRGAYTGLGGSPLPMLHAYTLHPAKRERDAREDVVRAVREGLECEVEEGKVRMVNVLPGKSAKDSLEGRRTVSVWRVSLELPREVARARVGEKVGGKGTGAKGWSHGMVARG